MIRALALVCLIATPALAEDVASLAEVIETTGSYDNDSFRHEVTVEGCVFLSKTWKRQPDGRWQLWSRGVWHIPDLDPVSFRFETKPNYSIVLFPDNPDAEVIQDRPYGFRPPNEEMTPLPSELGEDYYRLIHNGWRFDLKGPDAVDQAERFVDAYKRYAAQGCLLLG